MTDDRQAALGAALAGAAQLATVAFGHIAFPYLRDVLIAIGHAFLLRPVAVLHVRHTSVRRSGAVLATIAGVSVAMVGLAGSVNVDLQPAALAMRGVWWWTIGKLWAETGVLPRPFGIVTALGGALAFLSAPFVVASAPLAALIPGLPDLQLWDAHVALLGLWLLALAVLLPRGRLP